MYMKQIRNHSFKRQGGLSLIGLILTLGVLVFIAMLAAKVVPTVVEFSSIKKAIRSSKQSAKTVREIQDAFDKQSEVGYFDAVRGKDLSIVKNGEDMDVSFSYTKTIHLFGPASLLLEYADTTAKSGKTPKMQE
jgi:hypothetical protein